jgi:hypothetical protein
LLIEVEDVGRKKGRFPPNEEYLHVFLNEPPPIDWPNSRHCSEHGICHSHVESFRFFGHNELDHSPLSKVPTIPEMKPVFWIVLSSELPYIQVIIAARPPFALLWRNSVNLCADLGCPFL